MTTGVALENSSLIARRYALDEQLGCGTLGTVYRARDLNKEAAHRADFSLAIKVFHDELNQHPSAARAVLREAREARALTHPNIVQIYDVGREGSDIYMTMELLEGESLDRLIQRTPGSGVGLEKALKITRDICNAMAYAHGNLVLHTGLKPANVFLTRRGIVKVMDFGLAHAAECSSWADKVLTLYDEGSWHASSDGKEPGIGDDVYAIACVFYELLTGKHPYGGRSVEQASQEKRQLVRPAVLSRSQWRVLQEALDLRQECSQLSATDLADGLLARRKFRTVHPKWLAAIAASIVAVPILVHVLVGEARQPESSVPAPEESRATPQQNASPPESAPRRHSSPPVETARAKLTSASSRAPAKPVRTVLKEKPAAAARAATQLSQKTTRIVKRPARSASKSSSLQDNSKVLALASVTAFAPREDALLQTAALKEKLLWQAQANLVDQALITLGMLKERLPAGDPFLVADAPQAIADGYMRLAYDAVKNGDIEDALSLSIHGSKIAPDYQRAATARNRYLGYWEVSDVLRNAERISTSHVRFKMWRVSRLAPHEMQAVRKRWEQDLASRIQGEQNTRLAAHLSQAGRALFGSDPRRPEQMTAEASP